MTTYAWRGAFTNREVNALHAEAFRTKLFSDDEWNWEAQVSRHSLGWVVARVDDDLVGFVNVPWDGFTHAWLQDVMVAPASARQGIGTRMVAICRNEAKAANCEYLHVDFEPELSDFYLKACKFEPTSAGLICL